MISLEWVKEYIDIEDQDLEELAVKITKAGINIEKVITNHLENVVIGQVISCNAHPDSDHLHVCMVNIGKEELQIVCGAPNVREGLKVIVALVGAKLEEDFVIKKSKIRGVESNGMLCALYELGLEEKTDENYAKGIYEVNDTIKIGVDAIKALNLDSTLYELDIHKHRNNDCYYHIGFAYEIAAILNRKVTLPNEDYKEETKDIKEYVSLEVKTEKCPYYLAKMVCNVEIKPSPDFIQRRLKEAGMRPINNVVDISNYVMLEYGQPLHFFDQDKLGNTIIVRDAKEQEELITLDKKMRILKASDIVIANKEKSICVAGVMGGENTEVDENTKNIVIESAIFDAVSIRYTATHLNLKSEASIRYGKGLNYEYTKKALNRACHLLEKYAKATILTGTLCHDKIDKTAKIVEFSAEDINKMLGITISKEDMETELNRLDFPYTKKEDIFQVTIPNRRLDIDPNVNDIAEEIGRLYGYHNLISTLPRVPIKKGEYIGDVKYRKIISKRLRALGLNEAKTYTLISPTMADQFQYEEKENLILPNPMSIDKSRLRTTLLPSLLNVYEYNKARKVENICLYEISKTYDKAYQEESKIALLVSGFYSETSWNHTKKECNFYYLKGLVENLLDYLGFKNRYEFEKEEISSLHPGISARIILDRKKIGIIGCVHPKISKDRIYVAELSLNSLMTNVKSLKYKEAPKYPGIRKDLSFQVKKEVTADTLQKEIKRSGGRLLKEISVFDVYVGEKVGKDEKSIAFNLVFEAEDRTLTDEEVMISFNKIIENVTSKCNAILRDR